MSIYVLIFVLIGIALLTYLLDMFVLATMHPKFRLLILILIGFGVFVFLAYEFGVLPSTTVGHVRMGK